MLKEFLENFEREPADLDKNYAIKIKSAIFAIYKKNWEVFEKISKIVILLKILFKEKK